MHIEDITERKNLEAELHHRAQHDPLTGLANRLLLIDHLEETLRRRGSHSRPGHLFYLDLDGFKPSTTNTDTPRATKSLPNSPSA